MTYRVKNYGITVLTDTTERAPTFSLVPFDQLNEQRAQYSLCYVSLEEAADPATAWTQLLNRQPRSLEWPEVDARTTSDYLYQFDFSIHALERRRSWIPDKTHHEFRIGRSGDGIGLRLGGQTHEVATNGLPELFNICLSSRC